MKSRRKTNIDQTLKNKKGFTLIELMVVLGILAIILALAIPSYKHLANKSKVSADQVSLGLLNKATDLYQTAKDLSLDEIFTGATTDNDRLGQLRDQGFLSQIPRAQEKDKSFAWDATSHRWVMAGLPGPEDPGSTTNTENHFFLTGDEDLRVDTWGDLETFDPRVGAEPGINIPTGTIFYYQGEYYLFRYNQYLTNDTDIPALINDYGVKINYESFTTPGPASEPGDMKLMNQKAYVFFPPASRFYKDYLDNAWWFEITLTP